MLVERAVVKEALAISTLLTEVDGQATIYYHLLYSSRLLAIKV